MPRIIYNKNRVCVVTTVSNDELNLFNGNCIHSKPNDNYAKSKKSKNKEKDTELRCNEWHWKIEMP